MNHPEKTCGSRSKKTYKNIEKDIFINLKPLTIDPGTKFDIGPSIISFGEPHYEVIIGIGKDDTCYLYVPESTIKAHPKIFATLKNTGNFGTLP